MDGINYLGFNAANEWERLSWKTKYAMILANNTKWVSSQLFACGRAKLGPLGRRHFHHLILITKLLLVWPVGHIDPLITDWVTKPSHVPWTGNLEPTNFSSSYIFQFPACILSIDCQEYNYFLWNLICPRIAKNAKWLQINMLNI